MNWPWHLHMASVNSFDFMYWNYIVVTALLDGNTQ